VLDQCLRLARQAPTSGHAQHWPPTRPSRVSGSVRYLAMRIHEVPVHVILCVQGRTDG
jgi:hypothetical protein